MAEEVNNNPAFWWNTSELLYKKWVETKSKEIWNYYIISLNLYYKAAWGESM
jgi:hypothetical protein